MGAAPVAFQGFQTIAWRRGQVIQTVRRTSMASFRLALFARLPGKPRGVVPEASASDHRPLNEPIAIPPPH